MNLSRCLIGSFLFGLSFNPSQAQAAEVDLLPDFDRRQEAGTGAPVLDSQRVLALTDLQARVPGVRVAFDPLLAAPRFVHSIDGFLSGPLSEKDILNPPVAGLQATREDLDLAVDLRIREFLDENAALFGYDSSILKTAHITREFLTPHNGLQTVVWQQELDGIPIYGAVLYGHVSSRGELVSLSTRFVPRPTEAADRGLPDRASIQFAPPILPPESVVTAAENIGERLSVEDAVAVAVPEGPELRQRFSAAVLRGYARTSLVWLPIDQGSMRLCWRVILEGRTQPGLYQTLVDAQSGDVRIRQCWTSRFADVSYLVYSSDSPTPLSPGHPEPSTQQPLGVAQIGVMESAVSSSIASPLGWITPGETQTKGNNVDAHLDTFGLNPVYEAFIPQPPEAVPMGSIDAQTDTLKFQFETDLQDPPQPPNPNEPATSNQKAAVVNAFYWANWMHDRL